MMRVVAEVADTSYYLNQSIVMMHQVLSFRETAHERLAEGDEDGYTEQIAMAHEVIGKIIQHLVLAILNLGG